MTASIQWKTSGNPKRVKQLALDLVAALPTNYLKSRVSGLLSVTSKQHLEHANVEGELAGLRWGFVVTYNAQTSKTTVKVYVEVADGGSDRHQTWSVDTPQLIAQLAAKLVNWLKSNTTLKEAPLTITQRLQTRSTIRARLALTTDQKEYQKLFKKLLSKYKVKSPSELSAEDKAKFFEEVDKSWNADDETD